MIPNPTLPVLTEPKRVDVVLNSINTVLTTNLNWLTAYGRVSKIKTDLGFEPLIYTGETTGKEYLSMLPDGHLNNYCFWDIKDGESIEWNQGSTAANKIEFGLIFFFNYQDIYISDWKERSLENVKHDVIQVFKTKSFPNANISLGNIYHEANNIYKGYAHNEVKNQFLMRPYGAFRLEGTLFFWESC